LSDLNPRNPEKSNLGATFALDSLVELLLDLAPSNMVRSIAPQLTPRELPERTQRIDRTAARLTKENRSQDEAVNKTLQSRGKTLEQSKSEINTNAESFEAFRQNSAIAKTKIEDSKPNSQPLDLNQINGLIGNLEQKLQQNKTELDALIETTNTLMPLLVELVKSKTAVSEGMVVKAVVPRIDRIIQQRASQDLQKMAAALADIIPAAISAEIERSPQEFARAIAPEIAAAITEQIRLDKNAIATTLGPEMGKAIKTQIECERDAMVDALYPVIGSTIAKYMSKAIEEINAKVENAFSPEGFKRKIRAKLRGVSEAELILQEAIDYKVQAIFLIHKASGLVIKEIQPNPDNQLDADLLAGMLTAIRSFVNEYIARSSEELNEIEYGDSKIILEVAGYCYLAIIVKGEPDKDFLKKIQTTLSDIILKHGNIIEAYDGDPTTIPEAISVLLNKPLLIDRLEKKESNPKYLIFLASAIFSIIFIPWGVIQYRSYLASSIEQQITVELDAAPELSIYRIMPQVHRGKLILTGRVPNYYLRDLAEKVVAPIAARENLQLQDRILTVEVPPNPEIAIGEIRRLTSLFNQRKGIAILVDYRDKILTIKGSIVNAAEEKNIMRAFEQIPGITKIISKVSNRLPIIHDRIYFEEGSKRLDEKYINTIIVIQKLLKEYPDAYLKIIGHSDRTGGIIRKRELALQRAIEVRKALLDRGLEPSRMRVVASLQLPPDLTAEQPLQLSRCVRFEVFSVN
jgi:flagellar motor protein MotB